MGTHTKKQKYFYGTAFALTGIFSQSNKKQRNEAQCNFMLAIFLCLQCDLKM